MNTTYVVSFDNNINRNTVDDDVGMLVGRTHVTMYTEYQKCTQTAFDIMNSICGEIVKVVIVK
jgi:hypothetical protein